MTDILLKDFSICIIRSENDLKRMRKGIFRTNHTYHNCLLESSHLENPSVLMGWWTGIRMANKNLHNRCIGAQTPVHAIQN